MTTEILFGLFILAVLVCSILAYAGVFTPRQEKPKQPSQEKKSSPSPPYIKPTPFKTGYIQKDLPVRQNLADLCNNTNMYPVRQPYVSYGDPRTSNCCGDECDVNVFNAAP